MKIAFVNAPFLSHYSRTQRSPAVTKGGTIYYPYWLAYACGWVRKNGHNAYLYDFIAQNSTCEEALNVLKSEGFGLIIIDTATPSVKNDIKFAQKVKKKLPKSTIILVGTHVSAVPEETLKSAKGVDGAAIAEYDQTIVEVANMLEKGKSFAEIPGLCILKEKKWARTPPRRPLSGKELNQFPFVSEIYKQFLNIKDYYFAAARYPMVMIITARGCPFGCNFCLYWQTLHGKTLRSRSPENVASEFKYIAKKLPEVKEVVIEDDTFTANRLRIWQICELLIKQGNKIPWSANVRVGIDLSTMKIMKKAGCRLLITGFESADQILLDNMDKKATIKQAYQQVKNAKKANLLIHACYMVGNPGETKKTMQKTLDMAVKFNTDSAQFYPLFVYPGTKSYAWFEKKSYLKTHDYSQWLTKSGEHNTVISLPGLSAKEMVDFCEKAYLAYYLRPAYLWMKFKQIFTNPSESIRSLKSAFNYIRTKSK